MYSPPLFKQDGQLELMKLMSAHPFATVITTLEDGSPFVSHLPVLTQQNDDGSVRLLGHMARANPHWRHFESGCETLFIFHGPDTYVTPKWYLDPLNVPTWNYAVVHAHGIPKLVQDAAGLHAILDRTVQEFEKAEAPPWTLSLPEDFRQELMRAIVGFEVLVSRIEGKFKLSQNRAPEDRQGVLQGLRGRTDEKSRQILELMLRDSLL